MANGEKAEVVTETKKRKRKEVAIFGNYRNYYGYRVCRDMKEDPRLMVLKKEWFEGKDCLDIGCNQGLITIEIAKNFNCRCICGVYIDSYLVENAYWNLNRLVRMESANNQSSNASKSELSQSLHGSEYSVSVPLDEEVEALPKTLFDRISFRKQNFVERLCRHSEMYDTILCLSVTKWIHLNWEDDGLITLFVNIWRLLRPGGILVLEPQPWKSYKKNYLVSETATLNYHNILFHPGDFQEILLDKIGFRTVENIASSLPGSVSGFDRPIFAFRK